MRYLERTAPKNMGARAVIRNAFIDTETWCEVPLKNGTFVYAESAEIMIFTFALEDGPVGIWDRTTGEPMPAALRAIFDDPDCLLWFHNLMFDRTVMKYAMPELYARLPLARFRCTMVKALAHALPGSLDTLCEVLNLPQDQRKLKTGKELVRLFCCPAPKNVTRPRATRLTHPEKWVEFCDYAKADIPSMREVFKRTPSWNYSGEEIALHHLDQVVNDRGFAVDLDLAHSSVRAVDRAQKTLAARTIELTSGEVERATQRDRLLAHILAEYGVDLPDVQKSTLERRINDPELPWAVRELLSIRLQAGASSTSKYRTIIKGANRDGRVRGCLQFDGASRTRRWAGRLVQTQNMRRPQLKQANIDFGIGAMKANCEDMFYDNVMELASSAMRGVIMARPGHKLVVSDLAAIEGRGLAWLAREEWKLKAFRDYDEGIGADMYCVAYGKSFGVDPLTIGKEDPRRQVGKVQELGLGFGGGVGAFLQFSLVYNLDLEAMAEEAEAAIPADVWGEAQGMYAWTVRKKRSTFGLSARAWTVCESFKAMWRSAHPAIAGVKGDPDKRGLWGGLEDAVREATIRPGVTVQCLDMRVRRDGNWLRIRLPSGRCLCYPSPKIDEQGGFSYMGMNQYTHKWSRIRSYGGKLAENADQSVSRDFLASAMQPAEDAGYRIVLTTHDELITEAPDTPEFSHHHLSSILATVPSWAPGMPLAAAGFEAYRYRK